MIVLVVVLEMAGQVVDTLGQDRDLDFGRPRIAFFAAMFLDQRVLALGGNRHEFFPSTSSQ